MRIVFHLGMHKTGTSWLQAVFFSGHPDIFLVADHRQPWKDPLLRDLIVTPETHFDPDRCRVDFDQSRSTKLRAAQQSHKLLMISAERLSGHPYSGGHDRVQILWRIKRAFPEAEILLVIRNQIDAIRSVYKQMVAGGCTIPLTKLLQQRYWKTCGFDPSYWDYYEYLNIARRIFGQKAVKVLCYEFMKNNVSQFMDRLCSHYDLRSYYPRDTSKLVNPSLPDGSIEILRLGNYFRETEFNNNPLVKINIIYSVLVTMVPEILQIFSNDTLPHALALPQSLIERYTHNNQRLAEIVDFPLDTYGYPM